MSMAAVTSLPAAAPPALAGACVVGFAVGRVPADARLVWLAAAPGLLSMATTAFVLIGDQEPATRDGMYGLVEVSLLTVVLAAAVRWLSGPRLWTVAAVTACAQVAWIARFLPDRDPGPLAAGLALWSVPSLAAILVGGYPRLAAVRTRKSVSRARAQQRRDLERDLHDYVAHDLSGMVVQAQAARFAAGDDPERLRDALRRIEESGQRAMSSMDRALELLGEEGPGPQGALRRPGLDEVGRLVADFRDSGTRDVTLRREGAVDRLPREISETLYRVCVEALTNVRRHAPSATAVTVDLLLDAGRARLSVWDDGRRVPTGRRHRGGTGLRNARARVEALDGTFSAEAQDPGWRVTAALPVPAQPPRRAPQTPPAAT